MLPAGTRGIDYSGLRPDPTDVHAQGARFIVRYSAGAASSEQHPSYGRVTWKLCGPDEIRQAVAAGLDAVANSEWHESRVTEGAAAGREDGAADLAFWRSRGLNPGATIYVSWDEGQPDPNKHRGLADYLRAYRDALGGVYRVGLYAGDVAISAMLDAGLISHGWRAMADSWSGNGRFYQPGPRWAEVAREVAKVSRACLWQNGNRWYGQQADENVILRPGIGSHLEAAPATTPAPTPAPAPAKPATQAARPTVYTVRQGDTLSGIAARYGVDWRELARVNGLANPDLIHPGQVLRLDGAKPAPAPARRTHTVRAGDTLSGIAAAYGVTLAVLRAANPRAGHPAGNADVIWPGDKITIP